MNIIDQFSSCKGQIAVLIDPDKSNHPEHLKELIRKAEFAGINYFFVGGSTVTKNDFENTLLFLKQHTKIPIVIFPGSHLQISENADAILYLSLLSGRNPDFLIGHHIQSASELIEMNIEIIPTGYILIDGGTKSSVAYVSQTTPIPRDQISIAVNTATAGILQGKKLIYFDAGSGAKFKVPEEIIKKTKKLNIPVIVGGGIRTIHSIQALSECGANVIVIGNHIEEQIDFLLDIRTYLNKIK